jgi:hypothetical protein
MALYKVLRCIFTDVQQIPKRNTHGVSSHQVNSNIEQHGYAIRVWVHSGSNLSRLLKKLLTLPFFECDWQSLKSALHRHSLLKVQFTLKVLPKDFSTFSQREIPYLPVK